MGCSTSKLENEDAVSRCRERRRLIKQALNSRHLFAAAHSDYLCHLRFTGSALARFGAGEPLVISDDAPPTFPTHSLSLESHPLPEDPRLRTPQTAGKPSPPSSSTSPGHSMYSSSPSSDTLPTGNHELDGETVKSSHYANIYGLRTSSSMWNWENLYPPSAPELDSFRQREDSKPGDSDRHVRVEEKMEEVHFSDMEGDESFREGAFHDYEIRDGANVQENARCESESWVGQEKFLRPPANDLGSLIPGCVDELSTVRRHKDLTEIAVALEECFVKASEAGKEVTELLRMDNEHLHRNSTNLKKTVCHPNNLFALSFGWTGNPPRAITDSTERGALIESRGRRSHFSTLEQLLALENKLLQDVKAREAAKIEHEKKLNSLQSQEYRGENEFNLEKTKASIKKFESLIMAASQAVNTTSSAIIRIREDELGPQLLELCHGLMNMWKSMNHFHGIQNNVARQVHRLVNPSIAGGSTTDLHRQSSHHLQLVVSCWRSAFSRLTKYHRDYINFLHSWLRLTLHRIDDLPESVPTMTQPPSFETDSHTYSLCDEWRNAADRLPDTVASEAMKNFLATVQTIALQQSEELRCRKRQEALESRMEKKAAALRAVERKLYGNELSSNKLLGISVSGRSASDPTAVDVKDPLATKRMEVQSCRRQAVTELAKHTQALQTTRTVTLNNIQVGLPGVFQALEAFSGACSRSFESVYTRSRPLFQASSWVEL